MYIVCLQANASIIFKALWNKYRVWAPVFSHDDELWVRLSAHVYNVKDDFEQLRDAILELKDEEKSDVIDLAALDQLPAAELDNWKYI